MRGRLVRLCPQRLFEALCWALGHPQRRYSATDGGVLCVVYTCRCGRRQSLKLLPANRRIRRHTLRRAGSIARGEERAKMRP